MPNYKRENFLITKCKHVFMIGYIWCKKMPNYMSRNYLIDEKEYVC